MELVSVFFARQIGIVGASRSVPASPMAVAATGVHGRLVRFQSEPSVGLRAAGLRSYSARPSLPDVTHPRRVEALRGYDPRVALVRG